MKYCGHSVRIKYELRLCVVTDALMSEKIIYKKKINPNFQNRAIQIWSSSVNESGVLLSPQDLDGLSDFPINLLTYGLGVSTLTSKFNSAQINSPMKFKYYG